MAAEKLRHRGKTKTEIADEAFADLGPSAKKSEVDAHFRRYNLKECESTMYYAARKRAASKPSQPKKDKSMQIHTPSQKIGKKEATRQVVAETGLTKVKDIVSAVKKQHGIDVSINSVYEVLAEVKKGASKVETNGTAPVAIAEPIDAAPEKPILPMVGSSDVDRIPPHILPVEGGTEATPIPEPIKPIGISVNAPGDTDSGGYIHSLYNLMDVRSAVSEHGVDVIKDIADLMQKYGSDKVKILLEKLGKEMDGYRLKNAIATIEQLQISK